MPKGKGYGDGKYGSKTASGKPKVYSQFNEAGRKYVKKKREAPPPQSGNTSNRGRSSDSEPLKVKGGLPAQIRARKENMKKY